MKLQKKVVALALVCCLFVTMSASAFAAGKGNGNGNGCNQNNNIAFMEKEVEKANAQIEKLVAHAQKTAKDDVEWLLDRVDNIVAGVQAKAQRCGVTVVCEYVAYEIDGRIVLIDPLMVIN